MVMLNRDFIRAALYIRVSTEEQALHGFSLAAQEEALVAYAKEKGITIVSIYRDEGFSARKPVLKRPAMQELLADVESGKVQMILFTKLDRWFRNVGDYHTIQRILDKHHVVWRAILEDYQTETADGRLKVNIMLSVAENEADRTAERIRFVFDSRVQKGEAPFPTRIAPFGYKVDIINGKRRLVIDQEEREIVEFFFRKALSRSIRYAGAMTNEEFGLKRAYTLWHNMTRNEMYTGTYKGVENYCEPYLTKEEFRKLNEHGNYVRKAKHNRTYIFAGLLKCPDCGRLMSGKYTTGQNGREYIYYRCYNAVVSACTTRNIAERKIEKYLLENIRGEMEKIIIEYEISESEPKRQKKKTDVSKLQERLRRVNVSYHAGNLTDEEYLAVTSEIKQAIAEASEEDSKEERKVNIETLRSFLSSDFDTLYNTLTKEERRELWCSIIDHIEIEDREIKRIVFRA